MPISRLPWLSLLGLAALGAAATRDFRQACGGDLARLCPDVRPGGGRVLRCLLNNRDQLSPECRAELFAAWQKSRVSSPGPDKEEFLEHDGVKRRYLVHLPQGYDGKRPLPVVLAFHGGFGRPEGQRKQSRLNPTADHHDFMVVYPEGLRATWNGGLCCGYAAKNNVDDAGFVRDMLGVGPNSFAGVSFRSVPTTLEWWVKANNCQLKPVEVQRGQDYVMERYQPAPGQRGAPVVLYKLPDGGHAWPGGVDVTRGLGTGKLIRSVNADEIMWKFFAQYSLDN